MFERKHIPAAIAALGTNDHHPSFAKRAWEEVGELFDAMAAKIHELEAKLEGQAVDAQAAQRASVVANQAALDAKAAAATVTQNALQTLPADTAPSSSEPAQQAAPVVPAVPAVAQAPAVPQQA